MVRCWDGIKYILYSYRNEYGSGAIDCSFYLSFVASIDVIFIAYIKVKAVLRRTKTWRYSKGVE
ncbi:MAG: hypothetical protein GXZ18_05185 [Synergistaceae bacterium]|nr:hypothetical protein [Synergistaceae bacterium]